MFSFWDLSTWIGCIKFPVLWWEYLASATNGLTYGAETADLTKGHSLQLDLWQNVEKVVEKFDFALSAVIATRQHVSCKRIFRKKTWYAFKYPPFSEWIISEIPQL